MALCDLLIYRDLLERRIYNTISSPIEPVKKLVGMAQIVARVVSSIGLFYLESLFSPAPSSGVGYPFQLYKQLSGSLFRPNFTRCVPMIESAEIFFDLYFDPHSRDLPLLITLLGSRHVFIVLILELERTQNLWALSFVELSI